MKLTQQFKHCNSLPTLPSIALQIIDLANDSDSDINTVCSYITYDPALSIKLLKTANSPLYKSRRTANNVRQAISILGTHAVVSISLSFVLVDFFNNQPKQNQTNFDSNAFWRRSITSALASRSLGKKLGLTNLDDLFLAGLLQDIGILAFLSMAPEEYIPVFTSASDHDALLKAEYKIFETGHNELGYSLLRKWHIPDYICTASLTSHNKPTQKETFPTISSCVAVSGHIADYFLDPGNDKRLSSVTEMAKSWLNLDSRELMEILNIMEQDVASIQDLFEVTIHHPTQISEIISEAKELLLIHYLHKEKQLEEKAQHDGLTGARNRAYFDEATKREFLLSTQQEIPLTIAMIDLDHFKNINDTYGHQVGDALLVAVVQEILTQIRTDDTLSRYGGEEFALILPGTELSSAKKLLSRLKECIAAIKLELDDGRAVSITTSIGFATHMEDKKKYISSEDLIKAADFALYDAKRTGRNKVREWDNTLQS
jgi:diguanylate cyclase (GGDEF)-like protein